MPARIPPVKLTKRQRKARDALVLQFSGLPRHIVNRLRPLLVTHHIDLDDAEQIGMIGLLKSAPTFDPTRGVKPMTYLFRGVRNAILHEVKRVSQKRYTAHKTVILQEDAPIYAPEKPFGEDEGKYDPLRTGLAKLCRADRALLTKRYLRGYTLQAVADERGLSKERIRQLQARALERLRVEMGG